MFNLAPRTKRLPARRDETPYYSLQREINRLFDGFFTEEPWTEFAEITPKLDVSETDNELVVKMDIPGMNEKDVSVAVNKEMLTISGEKKQEKEEKEKGWYRMEREYGSFTRSIALPYDVQNDKVEAVYKNGVLTVRLPKAAKQQANIKQVTVKSA